MNPRNPQSTPELREATWRLWLAYRGTRYSGWQAQKNGVRTVQAEVEKALAHISTGPFTLRAAGRTDAGVHARGQALSVRLRCRLDERKMVLAMSSLLPDDISVTRADEMPARFDAKSHAIGKRYVYRIHQGLSASPFTRPLRWHIRRPLDLDAMIEAAGHFVGEKDFESFRSAQCDAAHARRMLWRVSVQPSRGGLAMDIRGNAFCRNMVRVMVGTLVEVGLGKIAAADLPAIFEARNRQHAGATAPAQGLFLDRVYYPDAMAGAEIPEGVEFPRYPVTEDFWPPT
jgi:tRNA pseudouridine38-40 synthase